MSYNKDIPYNDYIIDLQYSYIPSLDCLVIDTWTVYYGENSIDILCRIESSFIQEQLNDWLNDEWRLNSCNYQEEYEVSLLETRYDRDTER